MEVCEVCGKECKNVKRHHWKAHGEGINHNPKKGVSSWNKGLSKDTDERVKKYSDALIGREGTKQTDESKANLSEVAKRNGLGGVTQSRWIKYKGKTLGSSYELAVAISLDDNDIKWDTCKRISYIDPFGKKRTYTPDFYLIDYDVYLDPKNNFLIENINPALGFKDVEKIKLVEEQNGITVLVLNKDQLTWDKIKCQCSSIGRANPL